jgi:hypothetical protein
VRGGLRETHRLLLTTHGFAGALLVPDFISMSQANPLRIFVTHLWETSDDYLRVFEYLESARNFFYRNYSTPDLVPVGDNETLKENLRKQIGPVEAVIALSSVYEKNKDLVTFQLLYAGANNIPVILMKPFGDARPPHKVLAEHASEIIDWDERALVDAVRKHARHEDTTRWDTIEFKLD